VFTIVPFLMSLFVEQGEFVYKEGEYADEIYFIHRGRVNLVHEFDGSIYVYKAIQRGSYFGEIEVIKQATRKYNTQAAWHSDLLTLNRILYQTIQQDFPDVDKELQDICEVREKLNSSARHKLLRDLKANHRRAGVMTTTTKTDKTRVE
jgi:CRP-like cAMP-binding protein